MNYYDYYYENIVKNDLLNKFQYKNVRQMPRLTKLILNFGCKKSELKLLGPMLTGLELISSQRGSFTRAKMSNISLKIKKGSPVGCKITIRKTLMYSFLEKFVNKVLPKLKRFAGFKRPNYNLSTKAISFKIKNSLLFPELKNHYQYFNRLPPLNFTIMTNTSKFNECIFLLKSFKIPIHLQM